MLLLKERRCDGGKGSVNVADVTNVWTLSKICMFCVYRRGLILQDTCGDHRHIPLSYTVNRY